MKLDKPGIRFPFFRNFHQFPSRITVPAKAQNQMNRKMPQKQSCHCPCPKMQKIRGGMAMPVRRIKLPNLGGWREEITGTLPAQVRGDGDRCAGVKNHPTCPGEEGGRVQAHRNEMCVCGGVQEVSCLRDRRGEETRRLNDLVPVLFCLGMCGGGSKVVWEVRVQGWVVVAVGEGGRQGGRAGSVARGKGRCSGLAPKVSLPPPPPSLLLLPGGRQVLLHRAFCRPEPSHLHLPSPPTSSTNNGIIIHSL